MAYPLRLQTLPKPPTILLPSRRPSLLRCAASDADLAADLSSNLANLRARRLQAKAAVSKSGGLLFGGLCKHLHLGPETARRRWRGMGADERLELAQGFVDEWGGRFEPLSAKSVVELVDEHLGDGSDEAFSGPWMILAGIMRIFLGCRLMLLMRMEFEG